jgi:YHS domain-containing protein
MTDVTTLINRIDQELEAEVKREKAVWEDVAESNRAREEGMRRYEPLAKRLVDLLKPRMAAFIERFKAVVKAEPSVREDTRAINLTFAASVAKVSLKFEVFPDRDVNNVRLESTLEIVPVLVRYDKQSVLEVPLDAVRDDAVVQWFDDRIMAFVKAYVALLHQDPVPKERLKDHLVEDPVTKIRFPKYLAVSTLQRGDQTYYFLDEDTRREFEKDMPAR